jgi:hypothetical protein
MIRLKHILDELKELVVVVNNKDANMLAWLWRRRGRC